MRTWCPSPGGRWTSNLFGPAGFVSADDGEVIAFSQRGFEQGGEGGDTLSIRSRLCVCDSEMVLNSLIYPI